MNENTRMVERTSDAALAVWLMMWNADSAIAPRICSEDFRIHFLVSESDGSNPFDDVLGGDSFARFLDRWRERHPGVVFDRICPVKGRAWLVWSYG
ncbi:hypothetical protein A5724_32580 [Mycobacterium sp. ACS1612]|nr:hypothetical protein A5724_32580 [Mycobacterium sp. ACS1612]